MIAGSECRTAPSSRVQESMATEGNNTNGRKQSRSQRRRDTENAVFEELAELLPVSQEMKHDKLSILRLTVAYLKLRGGLETDEQDLEECLADVSITSVCPTPNPAPKPPPLAMLDSDGNLIAGCLNQSPATKDPTTIALPEKVVSELENTFLSGSKLADNNDISLLKEKFQKYKEGLEKGMQEFLNQDSSYNMFENRCSLSSDLAVFENSSSSSSDLAKGDTEIVYQRSRNCGENTTARQGTAKYSTDKENRICKKPTEHKKDTTTSQSSVSSDESGNTLALVSSVPEGIFSLEASSGFIVALDKDKRVLFVTENVSQFLGHCQWSVIGQNVSEFVYEKDYPELERQMSDTQFHTADGTEHLEPWQVRRTFYMAMQFCFQKPGSRQKDCGFQLYQWNAKLRLCKDPSTGNTSVKGLVSLCCPLQRDAMLSVTDNANFFMVRFRIKDSRILYCDPKIKDLLGYAPSELIGIKHSDLKHPSDAVMCRFNYRNLPADGKCESGYYRLLSRVGIWVWMYSHVNIVYNRDREPEVLTMKNIIVSQAEAECVLSREKMDFEKLRHHSSSDVFSSGISSSSIAAFQFQKIRKKRRPAWDTAVDRSSSSDKPMSSGPASEKTQSFTDKNKRQQIMQDVRTSAHSQATGNCSRGKPQTEIEQKSSQDTPVGTSRGTASSSCFVSPTEHDFNNTDSDSFGKMLFSQKMVGDIYAALNPIWRAQANSTQDEWSLNSLLFDDSQNNQTSCLSSNEEASLGSIFPLEKLISATGQSTAALLGNNDEMIQLQTSSPSQNNINFPLEKLVGATGQSTAGLFSNNNKMGQLQTSSLSQTNTGGCPVSQPHTSDNPFISTQEYSYLIPSDYHSLDHLIDFLEEETSSYPGALLMASSGDVMLSSATAPQPITSKQESGRFLNSVYKPDFQKSQTNYNNTEWLFDNMGNDDSSTVVRQQTVHSSLYPDRPVPKAGRSHYDMGNFGAYTSVCDAPPIVSGESDIIYSPGKLDYPPFPSTAKANQVSGQIDELYTRNNLGFTKQVVSAATSCKQNIHQRQHTSMWDIGINKYPDSSVLTFPETFIDKTLHGSDQEAELSKDKVNCNKQVIEQTLTDFSNSVGYRMAGDICNYLTDANIAVTAVDSNPTSTENSDHVGVLPDLTDSASKLPEDLLDLELDCDWLNS